MSEKYIKNIDFSKILDFKKLIGYVEGGVESRALVQRDNFSITLFAYDQGEGVSAYSMPGDTMLYVYEGKIEVVVNEEENYIIKEQETFVVPADVLYSINAVKKTKYLLIIVKEED